MEDLGVVPVPGFFFVYFECYLRDGTGRESSYTQEELQKSHVHSTCNFMYFGIHRGTIFGKNNFCKA